jgi:ubiquitin carboxyl-terminal hydrolase L5
MHPKTPRKAPGALNAKSPSTAKSSSASKGTNGTTADPLKHPSISPSRKRALPDTPDETSSKKVKDDAGSPTKPADGLFSATHVDPATWQGFCEIESEPGYFSVMLREMGVKDVTVRDVLFLDAETIAQLPKPIYGLILLFRARQVNSDSQELECPRNVWFTNQLPGQNSCATVAMINTLMNHESTVDLGEHLKQFKEFTASMTPYQRAEALSSFDFVKKIHNSFAKKMDILENDKALAHKVAKANYRKKNCTKTKHDRRDSEDSTTSTDSLEEAAHHFIAFVPIDDEIWKLDGMDEQPTLMGDVDSSPGNDWLTVASDHINTIMAAGDNDYSIIAIAEAPLASKRRDLCTTVVTSKQVTKRISTLNTDWASFVPAPQPDMNVAEPMTPKILESVGVFETQLAKATVPAEVSKAIDAEEFPALLQRCAGLGTKQIRLRDEILVEMMTVEEENEKARERRTDLGPLIKRWCEMLAENGHLEQHLEQYMPKKSGK